MFISRDLTTVAYYKGKSRLETPSHWPLL